MSVAQILAHLADFPTRYVVVTGGEPLIASGIEELCRRPAHGRLSHHD